MRHSTNSGYKTVVPWLNFVQTVPEKVMLLPMLVLLSLYLLILELKTKWPYLEFTQWQWR